ncbi:MAG: hypothetical protein ACREMG_11415, partial [Gemmatimonadales bacterium]
MIVRPWPCLLLVLAAPGRVLAAGPDVTCSDIAPPLKGNTSGNLTAYSFGATECNHGDAPLPHIANTTHHPVFVQNVYRLRDSRFEQIGMSWAFHTFCALQGQCSGCIAGQTCTSMGVGCSSPDSSNAAGTRTSLGRRSEINPVTGVFAYPYTSPSAGLFPQGRLQIDSADLDPALNVGASYYIEVRYGSPDDAAAGNGLNNASYRPLSVSGSAGSYTLALAGATVGQAPALTAWASGASGATITTVDVAGDGRF